MEPSTTTYYMTCSLHHGFYYFMLWDEDYQPVSNSAISYSGQGEHRFRIKPTAFADGAAHPHWDTQPDWWSITDCIMGLAKAGPRGSVEEYKPPQWMLERQTSGDLVISDCGQIAVNYELYVQITVKPNATENGYPPNAVIIWDPELQNGGGGNPTDKPRAKKNAKS